MKFSVLTLFPEMINDAFSHSITGRALKEGKLQLNTVNIRDFTKDKHNKVDDYPYGGGAGMLMQAQPVYDAFKSLNVKEGTPVLFMTPVGETFTQKHALRFAQSDEIVILCGHYEGIDERVIEEIVTDRISIGDFVLTGGEMASLVVMDTISRLVPGVLGNDVSAELESFSDELLEFAQYSRPEEWNGRKVPEILLSGDHKRIEEYRLENSIDRTKKIRPDLYEKWAASHPEYFAMKEKKRKKEEEKARKKAKKLANQNDM